MGLVQNSIGLRWETVLNERYPELESTSGDLNVPDFHHPSGFWVEAKAGNRLWGGRVKEFQFEQESELDEPVVYAFGMHNLDEATRRLKQKTERGRQRFLEQNMAFVETYFVSGEIVKKLFEREKRVSAKMGLVYCMVKPSTLRNILLDRAFHRFGKQITSSSNYYEFNRAKYRIGFDGKVGYILDKRTDGSVARVLLI